MKFQLSCLGFVLPFLHIRFCELQKHRNELTNIEKRYHIALALLITGCAQHDVYCSKQNFTVKAPKETITHHFFVSGIGQKKTVDAAKICGGAENKKETETQQTFVNGFVRFPTF